MGGDLDRTERCSARRSTSLGRGGREGYLAQLSPTAAAGEADESTSEGEELGGERGNAKDLVEATSGWRMGSIGYSGCVGPRRYHPRASYGPGDSS